MPGKKILVTGATGFLGSSVLPLLLQKGYAVHAVSSSGKKLCEGVVPHSLNLLDAEASCKLIEELRPAYMLHLAWETKHSVYSSSPENMEWVASSLAMLCSFAKVGGERFVSAGTCNEYDLSHGLLHEDDPHAEQSQLYGVTKRAFFNIARAFCKDAGVEYACGRIFFLYGERDKATRAVPYAVENLLSGKPVSCNAADAVRDYMYVGDGASAFVKLLESDFTGAMNIASGVPVTMGAIFSEIARQCGREKLLTLHKTNGGEKLILADAELMKRTLGLEALTSLEEGIARTIDWHRTQRGG